MEKLTIGEKLEGKDYNFRETCYGIVKFEDKVLLIYNCKKQAGQFSLPGGGIETGESLKEAITREFVEEAGLKVIDIEEIAQIRCYWSWQEGVYLDRLAHICKVKVDENIKFEPTENYHTRFYVEKENLLKFVTFPYQKAGIELYLNKFNG